MLFYYSIASCSEIPKFLSNGSLLFKDLVLKTIREDQSGCLFSNHNPSTVVPKARSQNQQPVQARSSLDRPHPGYGNRISEARAQESELTGFPSDFYRCWSLKSTALELRLLGNDSDSPTALCLL